MSHNIRCDLISDLGELHHGRKPIQPASQEIRGFMEQATAVLRFPALTFNSSDVDQIDLAFSQTIQEQRYTCYACAIMPDHIHLLIRKHKHHAEEMIQNLQRESRLKLIEAGRVEIEHPLWGGPGWKVFLDSPEEIQRTIRYIEQNPVKIGQPRQQWGFVKEYDGWPLHPGHDPRSPYAKRMGRG
jgi:REP element-mobilizing transposase RayT